jgi:hypothetical protein
LLHIGIQVVFPGNQILGLRATWVFNDTRVRNDGDCQIGNKSAVTACQGASGSTFDISANPGWNVLPHSKWEDLIQHIEDPVPDGVNPTWGIADVSFDDGPNVTLPIETWSAPDMNLVYGKQSPSKSVLAFGPNSTLIDRLLKGSWVPSSFMALFFGSRSFNHSAPGELLVGGYDKSRIDGAFVNYTLTAFPMAIDCPLRVKVKSVILNNDSGAHQILNESQTVPACIDLLQNQLTFTDAMYAQWALVTEHSMAPDGDSPTPFTPQTYPNSKEHLMDTLYIELEGGYNTTIPHYELIGPERGALLDHLGEYGVVNSSRIATGVGSGSTDYGTDFGMLLGGVFLASTYVFVDYENNKFGLAPAKLQRDESEISTVCSKDQSIPPPASISPTTSASPTTTASSHGQSGLSRSDKIAIGVSVPSIIAVFVGLIALFFQWKGHQDSRAILRHSIDASARRESGLPLESLRKDSAPHSPRSPNVHTMPQTIPSPQLRDSPVSSLHSYDDDRFPFQDVQTAPQFTPQPSSKSHS